MADFSALIQRIKDAVYENGVQAITGQILQDCLKDVVNTVNVAKQDGIYRVTVTVDNNTGVPSATARMDDDTYTLEFSFHNLKGETGPQGPQGDTPVLTADSDGVIYSDGVMLTRVIKDTTDALTTRADSDHARAESDHARAETDHTDITRARLDAETAAGEANYASLRANTAADNADAAREAIQSDLAAKQDVIPDLQQIRAGATDTVKYSTQSLTDAQKTQARTNIAAASDSEVSQLRTEVDGLDVNVGTWSVGSVNNPSGGHIPDYSSNRRMRTAELIIPLTAKYFFKVNSGYKFGLIVVGKRESLIWDSELSIDLQQGDVYRIVLREDPDPTNANIYSGWTQVQIDALIASSGFDMFVKSSFDELKEELETEINAVAVSAIKSEQYCEIDVPIWPHPNSYIQDGLIFFLDGKDFTSGTWVDKIGNSSFAMNNCVKDGDGVKFNGTTSYGTTEDNLSFPSQSYTIEMVIKGEKEVSASSDSQIIFNTKNSGDFALGFGMVGGVKLYTFQAGTTKTNLAYRYTTALGIKRVSVNKDKCVVDGEAIALGSGVGNWSAGAKVAVGSNASNTNWYFKGTIYAIRIYNRLLSESEMKANQMFDLDYYNL